jgi:predicted nuclease of restriction endonuclease-like (RecB) superfamily
MVSSAVIFIPPECLGIRRRFGAPLTTQFPLIPSYVVKLALLSEVFPPSKKARPRKAPPSRFYWNIGKIIQTDILKNQKAGYGEAVIAELSKHLIVEYGRGYSIRNLFNMIRFYESFVDEQILHTVCAKLSWSHLRTIMYIDDETKRDFYITMAINEHWSVRTMNERINSMLFERTLISKKSEETIVNDLKLLRDEHKMTPDLFFKNPYVLDFLNLADTYSEKDLENGILAELEKFILEMGRDFAFLGRQVRITINDKDYYIDLLFYHRKLRRLVVIELKLGEFLPEYKSQVELYLHWLEKYEQTQGEEKPIALILCAQKDDELVELLELDKSGIHVGQYYTELPPKTVWRDKLRKAVAQAKQLIEQRTEASSMSENNA